MGRDKEGVMVEIWGENCMGETGCVRGFVIFYFEVSV